MKKNKTCSIAICCSLLLAFISCDSETLSISNEDGMIETKVEELYKSNKSSKNIFASAMGHGTIAYENFSPTYEGKMKRQFTFHATTMKDGSTSGQGLLIATTNDSQQKVMFDINCMTVNGNTAVMSGIITNWKSNPEGVGNLFWFKVIDNGEGKNTATDQISGVYPGTNQTELNCNINWDVPLFEIEGGNIQVKETKAQEDNCSVEIGESYQGGIVFYILKPGDIGYVDGECHGLIAAHSDQSSGIWWWNGTDIITGATGIVAIGTGQSNTTAIISAQGAGSYAASLCDSYNDGTYSDWFLPSKNELNAMYTNLHVNGLGGFANDFYWSSSDDYDISLAWNQDFITGWGGIDGHWKYAINFVRAVRAF